MGASIRWIVLGVIFAAAAIVLYTTIDSKWAERANSGIWMTILFFVAAVATILCGFNAVDANEGRQS